MLVWHTTPNRVIDIATQRDTFAFCKPETDTELKEQCVSAISSSDCNVTGNITIYLHAGEDCPEYDHLFIQHNPQLFWWTPISGSTPTSQLQEGYPIAALQKQEVRWSSQPEHTSLPAAETSEINVATDFTYNPMIMFSLTTTTYADASWIKMDPIIAGKLTIVYNFLSTMQQTST